MVKTSANFLYGASRFIVGSNASSASYTSIQSAITAAALVGGPQTIYIQAGNYTENLIFPANANITLNAVGFASGASGAVTITGNQTLQGSASQIFLNGVVFVGANPSLPVFTIGSTGASAVIVNFLNSLISAGPSPIPISLGSGTGGSAFVSMQSSQTSGGNTSVSIGANSSLSANDSTFATSVTNGNNIQIMSPTASFTSTSNSFTAPGSNFVFAAPGSISSSYDVVASSAGTGNFVTGTAGTFSYSYSTTAGSAKNVAPTITPTPTAQSTSITWQSIMVPQTMAPNNGYIVAAGGLALTLPTSASVGNVIIVVLDAGTAWTITQAANQQIRLGSSQQTTFGITGSLSSSASGDSVSLVCTTVTPNNTWAAYSVQGNILIT